MRLILITINRINVHVIISNFKKLFLWILKMIIAQKFTIMMLIEHIYII